MVSNSSLIPIQLANSNQSSLPLRPTLYGSTLLFALLAAYLSTLLPIPTFLPSLFAPASQESTPYTCTPHTYTTSLISADPLLIYISNFTSELEANLLIESGYFPLLFYLFLSSSPSFSSSTYYLIVENHS